MGGLKNRIIIDTNLWISFLITNDLSKLEGIFRSKNTVLLYSNELIEEFLDVVQRPKFKKYFSTSDLQALLLRMRSKGEFVNTSSDIQLCRDAKDDFLLSLAKDGKATHLITGDKDLLVIGQFENTVILTMQEYISK